MEEPTTEKYLEARTKIVDDLKDAVIGNDWRSEEEKKLNFNPLYHFVSGILYPIDNRGSGYLAEQEVDESLNENDSKSENEEEIESNINPNARKKDIDEEDENPLEEKNIIDQSVQAKQSSFGINCITSLDEELEIYYGFSQYENKTIEATIFKKKFVTLILF